MSSRHWDVQVCHLKCVTILLILFFSSVAYYELVYIERSKRAIPTLCQTHRIRDGHLLRQISGCR